SEVLCPSIEAKAESQPTTSTIQPATASTSELACISSALILHADEVTVTKDKLNALIKTAGVNVESFWPSLFAKALADIDVNSSVGGGGAAAPAAEEKKREESEESDDDMGFGLFD
ncbi:large ribosomal subunit protein P1-like, partial [Hypanus sabinus]|uniref:large ribosomal subunit protein P1-like n=1 Tax=Hypanus sabinus TaxID=79690 RepID=UPI0028C4937F